MLIWEYQGDRKMSDNRFDREDRGEISNNEGVFKTWKGLLLFLAGFFGLCFAIVICSIIPPLKWLGIALVGLYFMIGGFIFLKSGKGASGAPWVAVFIGAVTMYMSIKDQFFPELTGKIGDRGTGAILISFALIMVLYRYVMIAYAKSKCRETVMSTVVRVDCNRSYDGDGHHVRTFRPVYEFMYAGREYTVMNRIFSSGRHPMVGESRELLIDENNPEVFYDIKAMKPTIGSFIFPAILVALGIYLIVAG